MKKASTIFMVAILLMSMAGCGASPSGGSSKKVDLIPGETITLGDWEVTPVSFYVTDRIEVGIAHFEAEEGKQYVVPTLRVKYLGKEDHLFYYDIDSKLVYQGEYEYRANAMITLEGDLRSYKFQPLIEVEGKTAFELPDDLANSEELSLVMTYDENEYWFELK